MRRYYKQKGVVNGIIKEFVGEIEMLDSGDLLQVCTPTRGLHVLKDACHLFPLCSGDISRRC